MQYENFITTTLKEAAEIARAKFGHVSGVMKPDDPMQVLTEADLAVGQFIISRIKELYPENNIIDEEAGVIDNGSEFTWIIDPIDGTSNFAQGIPTYGIMLGLMRGDKPLAGGTILPSLFNEIVYAEKGFGAFSNSKRINVTSEANLHRLLISYAFDYRPKDPEGVLKEAKIISNIASKSLNLRSSNCVFDAILTAEGKYGACLNQTSKIWDNIAQDIIITEAGGIYTDFFGQPMDYSNPLTKTKHNYTYCAAPSAIHSQLQAIIKPYVFINS